METNVCPLCGGELEYNQVFFVCGACFTPFNHGELETAWQAKGDALGAQVGDQIVVQRKGAVASVVINRPDQRNAISLAMWNRFRHLFQELGTDRTIGLVSITGAGDHAFSAGADVKEFEETRSTPTDARSYHQSFEAACDALAMMPQPSLAVVRGYCYGGGFELALSADLRVASESSSFAIPAARMGLAITHAFVSRLTALAGHANASYLLLSGRSVPAIEAHAMGLVNVVVPDDALSAYAEGLGTDILKLSPNSHAVHKAVLRDLLEYGAPGHVSSDRLALPRSATESADFREGVRAFLEKRAPDFRRS